MVKGIVVGIRHPHSLGYQTLLAHVPDLEIIGLVDIDLDDGTGDQAKDVAVDSAAKWGRPGEVAEAFEALPRYRSVEEAFAAGNERPSVAFVFLPNRHTPPVVTDLLERGCHVFCEKPMARTAAEMERLVQAMQANNVACAVGYTWRHNPGVREVRRLLAEGYLGRLLSLEARMVTSAVRARNPGHFLFRQDVSGGGILHWLGCHWLDVIRYITDDEVGEVSAHVATVQPGIDVEDVATVSMVLNHGTLAMLHAAYVLDAGYETYFGLRGEKGWIRWDPIQHTLHVKSEHPDWQGAPERHIRLEKATFPGYGIDGFHAIQQFLAVVEGKADRPTADAVDAMRVLEIIDAAHLSARERRHVDVRVDNTAS